LHDGAWTSPVDNVGVTAVQLVAPICGNWYAVHGDAALEVVVATGAAAYAVDHSTAVESPFAGFAADHDSLDALWLAPSTTSNGRYVLNAQIGL
jgi:hypothetical protein